MEEQGKILFTFIDFLEENQNEFVKKNCITDELLELSKKRAKLSPDDNYKDKQKDIEIQKVMSEKSIKIEPLYSSLKNKLIELGILDGNDNAGISIYNNRSKINGIKEITTDVDAECARLYLKKYLNFREKVRLILYENLFYEIDGVLSPMYDFFGINDSKQLTIPDSILNLLANPTDERVKQLIEDATGRPLKWLVTKQDLRILLTNDKIKGCLSIAEVERQTSILFIDKNNKPMKLANPKIKDSFESDYITKILATL